MSPDEQLTLRAHRILTDGRQHDERAKAWARGQLLVEELFSDHVERELGSRPTPREQSLGAQEWQ